MTFGLLDGVSSDLESELDGAIVNSVKGCNLFSFGGFNSDLNWRVRNSNSENRVGKFIQTLTPRYLPSRTMNFPDFFKIEFSFLLPL